MQEPAAPRATTREQIREQVREAIQNTRVAQDEAGRVTVTTVAPPGVATTQVPPSWAIPEDIPPRVQEVAIASMFMLVMIIIGFPIARAIARRIDRTGHSPKVPVEVTAQLAQLNQAVEAIAVEVERISEGQRFTTKLLSDQHKLPAASREVS
ncbi:MAG: hypothetical protein NUW01_16235 [Gemmatimonadaceae bacterium]|nr:hypothetical protein [Gemmatimonadaceae bacterium]